MSDDGTKVTLRMGPEEIQLMEDFMGERDIGNRSDFIRDAIKGYIAAQKSGGIGSASGSGIFVRFGETHLKVLRELVDMGICLDEEEFVRRCVLEKIVPAAFAEEAYASAFRNVQRAAEEK